MFAFGRFLSESLEATKGVFGKGEQSFPNNQNPGSIRLNAGRKGKILGRKYWPKGHEINF